VRAAARPRSLEVAGWRLSLLALAALHAPRRWIDPGAPPDELAWLPCHALLCERADEVVLVDCGLGVFEDVFGVEVRTVPLAEALASAGCAPERVGTVVLTHFDPDHAGGILRGRYPDALEPALPAARVVVLDADAARAEPDADHVDRLLACLVDAEVDVRQAGDDGAVAAGMRLRAAPGHRASHACVEIAGGGERFVFLADALHARDHVEQPDHDARHDSDPALALATRRALIGELAGGSAVVACSHVGAFGRIELGRDGVARWVDVG
jgi:glyoxylase-like metal-dependent hydrolase (beta-lactamase superfamily II)